MCVVLDLCFLIPNGSSQKFLGMNQDHKILYVWNGGKDGQIETIAYWVVKRESRNHMKHIDFDQ